MTCPRCRSTNYRVTQTRDPDKTPAERNGRHYPDSIYRRRQCTDCNLKWSTYELNATQLRRHKKHNT